MTSGLIMLPLGDLGVIPRSGDAWLCSALTLGIFIWIFRVLYFTVYWLYIQSTPYLYRHRNGMIDVSDYVEISSCNVSQSCIGMYTNIVLVYCKGYHCTE